MLPETERHVERLRNTVKAAKSKLAEARTLLGDNDDKYVSGLIRQATFWLDDVENFFIAMLAKDDVPPRTLAQESMITSHADFHLNQITLPLVKNIHDLATRYGPNFESIG
jgi:hypothetical protein